MSRVPIWDLPCDRCGKVHPHWLIQGQGRINTCPTEEPIDELIERSSLGTPEAKAIRAQTPPAVAAAIVDQAMSEAPGYHPLRRGWAKKWRGRVARRLADALAAISKAVGQ
jgi:hypothetical protein